MSLQGHELGCVERWLRESLRMCHSLLWSFNFVPCLWYTVVALCKLHFALVKERYSVREDKFDLNIKTAPVVGFSDKIKN